MNTIEHLTQVLGEEGLEVAKDCSKANRFGLEDRNVLDPTGPTNRERIVDELNDLMGTIQLCIEHGIIPKDWSNLKKQEAKREKVIKFMEYAKSKGALNE